MGHLGCLRSISAERPVKTHFRSVSTELNQTTRTQRRAQLLWCLLTKQPFWNRIMARRHADSSFRKTIRKTYLDITIALLPLFSLS
jgi:hypothetical protein